MIAELQYFRDGLAPLHSVCEVVLDLIRPCGSRPLILIVYHVIKTLLIFIYYEKGIGNRPCNINPSYFTSY